MKKTNSLKRKNRLDYLFYFSMVAWAVLHFLVFWGYVKAGSFALAFQRYNIFTRQNEFAGLYNFKRVWDKMILGSDPGLQRAFFNSFQAIGINIILLPIAVFSAYAFYKEMPGTTIFRVAFYIPQLISIVVLTMAFRYMFYAEFGPISLLVEKIVGYPVDLISIESDFLWPLIWIYCIWTGLGSNVIMMSSAMRGIPREINESAILDGVGFFKECFSIVIPLTMPTIGMYIIRASMAASTFLLPPMLLAKSTGAGGRFLTIPWYIFNNGTSLSQQTLIFSTTVGLTLTLLTTPLILIVKFCMDKLSKKYE